MAIIFMEGFGQVAPGTHPPLTEEGMYVNWDAYNDVTNDPVVTLLEDGTEGVRNYIDFNGGAPNLARMWYDDPQPITEIGETLTFGCRLYVPSTITVEHAIAEFAVTRAYIGIQSSANGRKLVWGWDNSHGTAAADNHATPNSVPLDTWFYVEVRVLLAHTAVGTCEIWIDGGKEVDLTNVVTTPFASGLNADTALLKLGVATNGLNSAAGVRITDIYMTNDGTILGPVEVFYQPCDTAGTNSDFTPSAGLNHQNVDDKGNDGDTTYNESTTPGNVDSFTHSDAVPTGVVPTAVQAIGIVRCPSGGGTKVRVGVNSGTASYGSTDGVLEGAEFGVVRGAVEETDPNTAAAWTAANLNAAETVIEHVV